MFSTEIGGALFKCDTLHDLAAVCFEFARVKRDQGRNVNMSQQFYEGQATAYAKLGVAIDCLRIGGMEVHKYIEGVNRTTSTLSELAKASQDELKTARARIIELENLIQNIDHIGDAHSRTGGGS